MVLWVDFISPVEEGFYGRVVASDSSKVECCALSGRQHLIHIAAVCQQEATNVCVPTLSCSQQGCESLRIPSRNSSPLGQGSHHPLYISIKRRVEKVLIQSAHTLHCCATRQITTCAQLMYRFTEF